MILYGPKGGPRIVSYTGASGMAKKPNEIYVERRPDGQYAVTRPNADRASAITPTQGQAIEREGEIAPDAAIHVERVRNTNVGHPDKWRNP
jgi:hypothetical protein